MPLLLSLFLLLTSQVITFQVVTFEEANAVSDTETNDLFSYFSNKFGGKSSANTVSLCTNGVLNNDGSCSSSCSLGVTGVSVTVVSSGSSSLPCDVTGYTGTVSYTCANGSATTTGSCSCAAGYTLVGGVCQPQCSISGVTGVNSTTVNYGSGTLTCNQTNFTGSVSYSCTNGTPTITGSCSCAAGYYLSGSTCAVTTCTATAGTGYNAKSGLAYAASGSGTFSCDATGYTGTKNYTCTSPGAATITGGTCTLQTCNISGITGLNNTTVNYGSGSLSCNQSGYTGTINYTCNSGGSVSTSGTCTSGSHVLNTYDYFLAGQQYLLQCSQYGCGSTDQQNANYFCQKAGYSSASSYTTQNINNLNNCYGFDGSGVYHSSWCGGTAARWVVPTVTCQ